MSVGTSGREATFLVESANDLRRAIEGLSPAQLRHRSHDNSWSIADVIEHLAAVEHAFTSRVAPQLADAPAADSSRDVAAVDQHIISLEPDPAITATADGRPLNQVPSGVAPRGRWQPEECADKFFASREQAVAFLKSVTWDRHEHVIVNSGFGPLDAQQWALFLSAHVMRHVRQIEGIRAAPGFPNE